MAERTAPSTIVDVAKAAGVSVATVSRALRGLDRVSPSTRERVRQVAEELNYLASPTATSLASGQTRIIGVIVPFASRWYFASMVSAIAKALRGEGYQVLLFDLEQEPFGGRHALTRSMLWKRVDGVVSINLALTDDELSLLSGLHVPVVSIGFDLEGRSSVGIDDYQVARTATEHILDLGHRRIAYVGAALSFSELVKTPQQRLDAFLDALADRDLESPDEWILATDWSAQDARRLTHELLAGSGPRPTAIVCASDEIAFGAHVAIREDGFRVPQDISLVGIDDHQLSSLFELTTVRQDFTVQGAMAAELLLEAVRSQGGSHPEPRALLIDAELIVRGSTAPPGTPDPA
ncbi:MAG: LacI family DNA-binding transcriptional regulator [Actinomycetia bacterium]|nr:LacI family DNA-binding transcriptional regulator [Actinomycetes bacterium]